MLTWIFLLQWSQSKPVLSKNESTCEKWTVSDILSTEEIFEKLSSSLGKLVSLDATKQFLKCIVRSKLVGQFRFLKVFWNTKALWILKPEMMWTIWIGNFISTGSQFSFGILKITFTLSIENEQVDSSSWIKSFSKFHYILNWDFGIFISI